MCVINSVHIYEQDKFKLSSNTSHIYLEDKCPDKMNTLNKQLMLKMLPKKSNFANDKCLKN